MTTDAIPPDPALELAALVATAIAGKQDVDREVLREVAILVIRGSDRVAQRLGVALASALLSALDSSTKPARAAAEAAFTPAQDGR